MTVQSALFVSDLVENAEQIFSYDAAAEAFEAALWLEMLENKHQIGYLSGFTFGPLRSWNIF